MTATDAVARSPHEPSGSSGTGQTVEPKAMRHGYFLAARGTRHGDEHLSSLAHLVFQERFRVVLQDAEGRGEKPQHGPYDGVSVFVCAGGLLEVRVTKL